MFRFLKDRFGREKEETPLRVRISGIPGLLEAREAQIAADLAAATGNHRDAVDDARAELRDLVRDLHVKEREEAYHPKLEKIARNTLPLFEKSMLSSLGKELPREPEEFYTSASECLKGCVKGLSGPGRYLKGVFPDEMKAIRQIVDRIGREVNAMTPSIAEARKKRDQITGLRTTAASLTAAIENHGTAVRDLSCINDEILAEEQEIAVLAKTLADLNSSHVSIEFRELDAAVAARRNELDAADRALRADLAVISHLLRKGEKILQRGEGATAAREIEPVVDALAAEGLPEEDQILPGITRTLPLIRSMIGSGEISLKNKEERELFSGESDVEARIQELYAQRRGAESRLNEARRAYDTHPAIEKIRKAEREKANRESRAGGLRDRASVIRDRKQALEAEIPELVASVEQKLTAIEARPVSLEREAGA